MGDVRKRSFTTGYLMGLSGMPVARAPGQVSEPLRLYNGYALPPFPAAWDKKTYPYAMIYYRQVENLAYFIANKSINYFEEKQFYVGPLTTYFGTKEDGTAVVFTCTPGESSWSQDERTHYYIRVSNVQLDEYAIWTNFDLMYSDNTLYVGASEPERIADWDALKGKYFYNNFIGPDVFGNNYLSQYYNSVIIKTEEAYIYFEVLLGFGDGSYFIVDDSTKKVYIKQSTISWHGASRMDFDSDVWGWADIKQYLGEEYERNGIKFWYVCEYEDLIWSHDDIGYFGSSYTAFYGSEPVPVPEPAEVNTDNKALTLGCRLGYIVRSQMEERKVPDGVLISSDGYILKDSNGLYLCAMKGE